MRHRRTFLLAACLSTLLLAQLNCPDQMTHLRADDSVQSTPENSSPAGTDEKAAAKKIAPDRFHEVDEAARLMVSLIVVCGLGAIALLALIVIGARRIRRLTRSPSLKSKYDELEYLRAKYHREVEGIDTPPPPSREVQR